MTTSISKKGRVPRILFAVFTTAFALCVAIQVLFAGLAIFVDAENWARHTGFVHFMEFLPLIMLLVAWAGKLPVVMRWWSFGLFFIIMLMYFTANVAPMVPAVSAFHPVIALALFAFAVKLMKASWRLLRSNTTADGASDTRSA